MSKTVLPVLDLQELRAGGKSKADFLRTLAETARTVGFFYVKGHQLECLQQQVFELSKQFFSLPLESKLETQMVNSPHFRGYTRIKGEITAGNVDFREQFDVMREEQPVELSASNPSWARLIGPNQWPTALPELRHAVLNYQNEQTDVSKELLMAFAEALGQPEDAFGTSIDKPYTHMKLIRYPGEEGDDKAGGQGVGAHKDPGYLTIVTQDQQSGLQVLKDDEGWVDVPPLDGAVVVNIGELLEMASDGYLRATLHRVQTPPAGSERYSVAFFLASQLDSTVPLFELSDEQKKLALGPESDPNNPMFYQVGENVLKGRMRSHPDVAEAWA
ncbi:MULTISPECIES: isopenicillin N synthase family oxygenase [Gammaproteobacteria]|uniref:isopenicillin N synthase family dioxygenase n=1 Tax=Gammaproteobacteria TaxID=1236 RepID=UPI000DD00689|nr:MULTISPECIES: 2-oxoglutarate and iron-dependent oxygenase domain-containing protein [Gammaproteobacteria]RTE85820.1 isopenicillin N synthase family oxygenase [Aliidiomarina sp. B3213]TCZ90179.1 isopenicillin N synthase family oxygenase [Lysobacter sp. N42]